MKETKSNHIEIDIINENCVKIQAKCNPRSIEERRNQESKESLLQISNNSLILSNTLSSMNTIRISKNSLAGSIVNGYADMQNKETPKKVEKISLENENQNFQIYDSKNPNSSGKKNKKYTNLKIEISKINTKNDEDELNDEQNNSNLCSQSVIYLSKIDEMNKLEISNKSIFFTPSICNYYQKSYIENSPNQDSSRYRCKNICEINDEIIPKTINMDMASNRLTPTQIRYNKGQLQSYEKSEKTTVQNNSNKMMKSKENLISKRENFKNKMNFEETNNFTLNNTIIDNEDTNENGEPKDYKKEKKEFQTFHDLVNEIKKELVLNISAIEEESSNNLVNVEEEEKSKTGNSNNYFIKNLGLNFCEMKINNDIASVSITENEESKSELGYLLVEDKKFKTDPLLAARMGKNCLSCINEISINIKPCRRGKIEENVANTKNFSSSNLTIQKPENISISIDEKKIPLGKVVMKNKKKNTSSLSKYNKELKKIYSKHETNNDSNTKCISNGGANSRPNSSKKSDFTNNYKENKTPDLSSKRKNSKIKNLSTFDVIGSTKNKVLKSLIMNLVSSNITDNIQNKELIPIHRNCEKYINKTVVSPTNIQTPIATQSNILTVNTNNSLQDEKINNRPNSNNNGVISYKKKEYIELINLLSKNSECHNRNKPKIQEQRTNSKGKTFEVSINLDQNDRRNNNQSAKKTSICNTSQNNSKSNSLSKKDSSSTTSTLKKISRNRSSVLPNELTKIKTTKIDNKNPKKNQMVPLNNFPLTSKNQVSTKNFVSDLMSHQRKVLQNKPNNVFINLNNTPSMNDIKSETDYPLSSSNQKKTEENSSSKKIATPTNLMLERNCESYKNNSENRSLFKNEIPLNIVKTKSDFVKIINNFSNYTKIKKDSNGKENINTINDNNYDYKKPVISLKIRNSGGDEDSVMVDEN